MNFNLTTVTLILGAIATLAFLIIRVKKGGMPGLYAKSAASFFFIATAVSAANQNSGFLSFASLMILGAVMGLLGDIWLDLKWIHLEKKDSYLYAGFISFLIGHLFYITAVYSHSPWTAKSLAVSAAGALVIAAGATLMEKPMKMNYGKFRLILFLYSLVLSFTVTSSIVTAVITGGETVWVVMSAGAVSFILSDLVLSDMYFSTDKNKNTPVNVVINHSLYYVAQFLMALTILYIK